MTATILAWIGSGLVAVGAVIFALFTKKNAKLDVAQATAEKQTGIAAANEGRDAAVVEVAKVREVVAKSDAAVAQQSADAATERTNVEQETAAAGRAANTEWMRDNGFLKAADSGAAETAGRGAGSAGSDPNR